MSASDASAEDGSPVPGRTLAIGDIHGCRRALEHLLAVLEPTAADTVVILGDFVNKGPDSKGVIQCLREWQDRTNLVVLRGNHEQVMLDGREDRERRREWKQMGGTAVLESYGIPKLKEFPAEHWAFLEETVLSYETEDHLFVHGSVDPRLALTSQPPEVLLEGSFEAVFRPHASGKRVVCGHKSQRDGRPADRGHIVCVDTRAWNGGWLTAIDVHTNECWQVKEKARLELRVSDLGAVGSEEEAAEPGPESVDP